MSGNAANTGRPISVAIVDDVLSVRTSLRRLCSAHGLTVTMYGSGLEFLEAVDAQTDVPDCLLLDAQMPEVTGLELQQYLCARGVKFPTLLLTADDTPEVLARYLALGVAATLRKPIAGTELIAAIERAVTNARAKPTQ